MIGTMQLNLQKINRELERLGWNKVEYARRLKISKQLLHYYLSPNIRGIKTAEKLAEPLNLDPKDLLTN